MSREIARDHALVTLRGLSTPPLRDAALDLITQMVARPALRSDSVEKIRTRLRNYHSSRIQTGHGGLNDATMGHLFAGHPYATLPAGTFDGLASITLEQLKDFHRKAYSANNVDIALVGDLSREEAETFISALVKTLPQNWAATPVPPLPTTITEPLHMTRPGSNTRVLLTQPLQVTPASARYGALLLANNILGAGIESRLAAELRSRRALTYAVGSTLVPMDAGCLWQIGWDIAPQFREASRELVADVLECFIAHGPSEAERTLALNKLAGDLLRTMTNNAFLAQGLTTHAHQGLPADHLATLLPKLAVLTVEDIRLAARDWLCVQQACFVTLGPTVYQQPLPKPSTMDA